MNLFLQTCDLQPTPRRPVWIMRQAGRYLPEYRAVRQRHSFKEMVTNPELCVELSLQPIRRYGLDAAIVFSDILVVLEALGVSYKIVEGHGPVLERAVGSATELERLSSAAVPDQLDYVYAALGLLRRELSPEVALLGFAGAPWTLACYLVAGGSSSNGFAAIKSLLETDPALLHTMLERLTAAALEHLQAQLAAGADAVQIFDSWAGNLTEQQFREFSLPYLHRMAAELQGQRAIFYLKGAAQWLTADEAAPFRILSVDGQQPLARYRQVLGDQVVLQGNLAPGILTTDAVTIQRATRAVLESHGPGAGHIFNLGHGITPDVPPRHVQVMLDSVRDYDLVPVT